VDMAPAAAAWRVTRDSEFGAAQVPGTRSNASQGCGPPATLV